MLVVETKTQAMLLRLARLSSESHLWWGVGWNLSSDKPLDRIFNLEELIGIRVMFYQELAEMGPGFYGLVSRITSFDIQSENLVLRFEPRYFFPHQATYSGFVIVPDLGKSHLI